MNTRFITEYDAWDKKNPRVEFKIGVTSHALQSIGVKKQNVILDSTKIIRIKSKHAEMTNEVIKQIPNVVAYPVLVMQSLQKQTRILLFGEVFDTKGSPVLTILELEPKGRNGLLLNQIKIASAYGKNKNPQRLIDNSKILYVDPNKKRTDMWLRRTRLQLPVGLNRVGSINKISYSNETVNKSPPKNKTEMARHMQGKSIRERKHLAESYMQNKKTKGKNLPVKEADKQR